MRTDAPTLIATAQAKAGSPAVPGAKLAPDAAVSAAVESLTRQPSPQELNAAVRAAASQIDSYLKSVGREVEFHVDEDTGMTVVTVRETATGDVIRQIPNEEVLQLARHFATATGSLLDLTV